MKFCLIIIITQLHVLNLVWLDSNASVTLVTWFTHSALLHNVKLIPSGQNFSESFVDSFFYSPQMPVSAFLLRAFAVFCVCVSGVLGESSLLPPLGVTTIV